AGPPDRAPRAPAPRVHRGGAAAPRPRRDVRRGPHARSREDPRMSARRVVVHPDAEVLAQATASRLLTRLLDLQSVRTPVHVVLTGGTVGIKVLADVAAHPVRDAVDWGAVHLWWGDDR